MNAIPSTLATTSSQISAAEEVALEGLLSLKHARANLEEVYDALVFGSTGEDTSALHGGLTSLEASLHIALEEAQELQRLLLEA